MVQVVALVAVDHRTRAVAALLVAPGPPVVVARPAAAEPRAGRAARADRRLVAHRQRVAQPRVALAVAAETTQAEPSAPVAPVAAALAVI